MPILLLLFGLMAGCLFSVIVGLIGSHRRIGFGWAFLLSVGTTPIIGLIVTLCSPKLETKERKWGCLGALIGIIVAIVLVALIVVLMDISFNNLLDEFYGLF